MTEYTDDTDITFTLPTRGRSLTIAKAVLKHALDNAPDFPLWYWVSSTFSLEDIWMEVGESETVDQAIKIMENVAENLFDVATYKSQEGQKS